MPQAVVVQPPSAPSSYALRFPESWWNLGLDPNTRDAAIRRRILAGMDERKVDRGLLDSLVRTVRRTVREAHARGALQLAGMFEIMEDGSPLIATTMVLRVICPTDGTAPELPDLMISYALRNAGNPMGKNTSGNRTEIIELPQTGAAGRVTSIEDIDFYGRGMVRMAIMQTVVPVPECGDFLVIASATPNLGLMDEFFEVFGAISDTLKFEA